MKKLQLLLENPLLNNYLPCNHVGIDEIFDSKFKIPKATTNPFIFSCFALSIDGKLCYPDKPSGFNVAAMNHNATQDERSADLYCLMLGRSISDAIIIGTNSINLEGSHYTPEISVPELQQFRIYNQKPVHPWTIIICRNLNKIDFSQKLFIDPRFSVMICTTDINQPIPHNWTHHKASELNSKEQLTNKNIVEIGNNIEEIVQRLKLLDFKIILNESPYFHHSLLERKLLNEIWLNYSCSYIGGKATSLGDKQTSFTTMNHPDTEILTLHHLDYNFLYSRQRVLYPE